MKEGSRRGEGEEGMWKLGGGRCVNRHMLFINPKMKPEEDLFYISL